MCIRDRIDHAHALDDAAVLQILGVEDAAAALNSRGDDEGCLLYTSDAADV